MPESWHTYRMRLFETVSGLGLTKASFCVALLYPTTADVACVDTHVQKLFLGHSGFKTIGVKKYLTVENKIRTLAKRHDVCTFIAQWMVWDSVRGKVEDHAIFPGSHKEGE